VAFLFCYFHLKCILRWVALEVTALQGITFLFRAEYIWFACWTVNVSQEPSNHQTISIIKKNVAQMTFKKQDTNILLRARLGLKINLAVEFYKG